MSMDTSSITTMEKSSTNRGKISLRRSSSCSTVHSSSSIASFMSGLLKESSSRMELAPHEAIMIDIVDDNAKLCASPTTLNHCRSLVQMRRSRSTRQMSRWSNQYERKTSAPHGGRPLGKATSDTMLLRLPQRKLSSKITAEPSAIAKKGNVTIGNHTSVNTKWNLPDDLQLTPKRTVQPKPNMFLDKFNIMSLADPSSSHPMTQQQEFSPVQLSPGCPGNYLAVKTSILGPSSVGSAAATARFSSKYGGSLGSADSPVMPTRRGSVADTITDEQRKQLQPVRKQSDVINNQDVLPS